MNSGMEPRIGTARTSCTTTISERNPAIQTISPIDQILLIMISAGVTGITSKCSTVPCSRSRMSAAPASTTDSMVICAIRLVIAPNQNSLEIGIEHGA